MKAVLVTSQVTYIPRNHLALFEELYASAAPHLAGLVLLDNLSPRLLGAAAGLCLIGCRGIAGSLARNILELPLGRRERIFDRLGLPVIRAKTMNDPKMVDWVKSNAVDLVINVRTRCIYKSEILNAPRLGCINIHHGLLPEFRGTMCDLYALWKNRRAGFTIHVMNEKIDAGRILVRQAVSVPGEKDYLQYLAKTGREEGSVVAMLLQAAARTGALPDGIPNRCEKPIFTRNPTRDQIRLFRQAGLLL